MRAVHFGAGNIGRGFVGLILHRAGYSLTFVDVNAELIDAINAVDEYTVTEVGEGPAKQTVTDFRAVNSATDPEAAIRAVAEADIVTCAVGPNAMRFIAPVIRAGLEQRAADAPRLVIMAVENAIGASDTLADYVFDGAEQLRERAIVANTAVDRIVPQQKPDGVNVVVEDFFEWAIDARPFAGREPSIPDAHFVPDLQPYIERKLFTVNTGHATTAYLGYRAGIEMIADALQQPAIMQQVQRVLAETSELIIRKFGVDATEHKRYVTRVLQRFLNPALPDTCVRIGRQPLRKLGHEDRFVRPALGLAELGEAPTALVQAYRAALDFAYEGDEQAQAMQRKLSELSAEDFVAEVSGVEPNHALFAQLVAAVRDKQES